jgi:type IV secretion system protein VirB10
VTSRSDVNGSNSGIIEALRRGAGESLNQTGLADRSAQSQHPADTDHPTWISGEVIVNRDLVLEPYRG